jgi:hypothetical protein
VVHNSQLFELHPGRAGRRLRSWRSWRRWLSVLGRDVMPLLVTAVAMSVALLTLVGLVAHPFPWSPPSFGGPGQSSGAISGQLAAAPVASHARPSADSTPAESAPINPANLDAAAGDPATPNPTASTPKPSPTAGALLTVNAPPLGLSASLGPTLSASVAPPALVNTLLDPIDSVPLVTTINSLAATLPPVSLAVPLPPTGLLP